MGRKYAIVDLRGSRLALHSLPSRTVRLPSFIRYRVLKGVYALVLYLISCYLPYYYRLGIQYHRKKIGIAKDDIKNGETYLLFIKW